MWKKYKLKIILAVVTTLVPAVISFAVSLKVNDAVQDSKIDMMAKDIVIIKNIIIDSYRNNVCQ
jgi:hypothetical protein